MMRFSWSSLFAIGLLAVLNVCSSERIRYDNYSAYKVTPNSLNQLKLLKELQSTSDALIFLQDVQTLNKDLGIIVAPHKQPDFELLLKNSDISYELLEKNYQKILDEEIEEIKVARSLPSTKAAEDEPDYIFNWNSYFDLTDTYQWMVNLTNEFPSIVLPLDVGKSYERRHILGLRISMDKGRSKKPGIFIEGGIHAREWIASTFTTYLINQLLRSTDPDIRNIANKYNWYIVPHVNVDGYEYTQTTNRLWRKTRSPQGNCFGVDPNRNWDFHFSEVGSSSDSCDETYSGPYGFSEIETLSLSRFVKSLKGKIQLYISFHSYSQLLLFPYGHTSEKPPNYNDLNKVFQVATEAITKRYGKKYTGGNIYDAIYPASGASIDWAYGTQDIKMAFTYELRPSSNSLLTGFRLPPEQIIPTGEETMDSVVAMVNEVERLGYFKI